jgi:hypothetical protein
MQRVAPTPATLALTVAAYVAATFGVQGASHFGVNAAHYAGVDMMRADPVIPLGITSMLIQGVTFAVLFPRFRDPARPVLSAVWFSWAIGGFLASYIALGEAGKYDVPSIPAWIAVEAVAAFAQFTVFGVLLGLVHRERAAHAGTQPA